MDNSKEELRKKLEENIEKINKLSPIKGFITKNFLGEDSVTEEEILFEKDGVEESGKVILSFIAGEEMKKYVVYTTEDYSNQLDDFKAKVEINEVSINENGYFLLEPNEEDKKKIVNPAIVAVGNSDINNIEEIEQNVRKNLNDENFKIVSMNTIKENIETFAEKKEEKPKFSLTKAVSVLIPVAKLKVLKKVYSYQVSKMYAEAVDNYEKFLYSFEIAENLDANDKKYEEVEELKNKFVDLNENGRFDKDIEELNQSQDALDSAKELYLQKLELQGEKMEDNVEEPVEEIPLEETSEMEEIKEDATLENHTEEPVSEEITKEEVNSEVQNEIVDKNADVKDITDEIISETKVSSAIQEETENLKENVSNILEEDVKSSVDLLKEKADDLTEKFNSEIKEYQEGLVKDLNERFLREQEQLMKKIVDMYSNYSLDLQKSLTTNLDQSILTFKTSLEELKNKNENLKDEIASTKKSLVEEQTINDSLRGTINDKDEEISNLKSNLDSRKEENEDLSEKVETLETDNTNKDEKIKSLEIENFAKTTENDQLKVDIKTKDSKILESEANLKIALEKNQLQKEQLDTMSKNMDDIRKEYSNYKSETEAKIEKMQMQLDRFTSFMNNMQSGLNQINVSSESKAK